MYIRVGLNNGVHVAYRACADVPRRYMRLDSGGVRCNKAAVHRYDQEEQQEVLSSDSTGGHKSVSTNELALCGNLTTPGGDSRMRSLTCST